MQATANAMEYSTGDFSFKYSDDWKEINETDLEHAGAKFFQNEDNVTIEEVTPPSDCYMDWEDCDIKGGWKVSSTDEKVKKKSSGDFSLEHNDGGIA